MSASFSDTAAAAASADSIVLWCLYKWAPSLLPAPLAAAIYGTIFIVHSALSAFSGLIYRPWRGLLPPPGVGNLICGGIDCGLSACLAG